jgi:hypothetical protein
MFRRVIPALLLLVLGGCLPLQHNPVPRFTVDEVWSRSKEFQGKRVAVTGVIDRTGYSTREASTFVVLCNSPDPRVFPPTKTLHAMFKDHIKPPRPGTTVSLVGNLGQKGNELRLNSPRFQSVEH